MKTQDLTEFGSGIEYDAQYEQHYHHDITFITRLIEETNARSVLDVCCGSGIVTIPVSEQQIGRASCRERVLLIV